jgi:phospholipase/carboxylesterase
VIRGAGDSLSRTRELIALFGLIFASSVPIACKRAPAPASSALEARLDSVEIVLGGANAGDPLPMIVVLHGLGDKPENLAQIFAGLGTRARVMLLRAPDRWGLDGYSWFPIDIDRGAESVNAADISRVADRVAKTVAELVHVRPTIGKPIVTGFSQGGMLSFALALHHADTFARALPVSGWIPPALVPDEKQAKSAAPIFAIHGDADQIVPFAATKELVRVLEQRGANVTLVAEPGVAHAITPHMRDVLFAELAKL